MYGSRVVGVVLSGALDDGAEGLAAVKASGGLAYVQDPAEALYPSMPESAILAVTPDRVASASELGALVRAGAPPGTAPRRGVAAGGEPKRADLKVLAMTADAKLVAMAEFEPSPVYDENRPGHPSSFSCPDCSGVLWERPEHPFHFVCHTGHAFDAESLLAGQFEGVDSRLWLTLRTLKDSQMLLRRLVSRALQRGHRHTAEQFRQRLEEADRQMSAVRALLSPGRAARTPAEEEASAAKK